MRKPVTPRMPRCECTGAASAAPSCPRYRTSAIRPLPDGSVFGTHIPNDFTPLAGGVANGYRRYTNSSVEIWPGVRQDDAVVSPGFGSALYGHGFTDAGVL